MSCITVSHENGCGITMISNRFLDEYMKDANDAQIKIYLYLLRSAGSSLACGISDIADYFNHTEQDVIRALKYWDKLHVISLLYDDQKRISGIRLEDLSHRRVDTTVMSDRTIGVPDASSVQSSQKQGMSEFSSRTDTSFLIESPITVSLSNVVKPKEEEKSEAILSFDKNSITTDDLRRFKSEPDSSQLIWIAEQYIGRPLNTTEIRCIYMFSDVLHFSPDLIDHLIQYCVGKGVKSFHYIEKVAIEWAQAGVTTPKQAEAMSSKYEKEVYVIMNAVGRSGHPTDSEVQFIRKWISKFGFSTDIILEACQRAVLATESHRLEYADKILSSWYSNKVKTLQDVLALDAAFQKRKSSKKPASGGNAFHQFTQSDYELDYDLLLEKIKA